MCLADALAELRWNDEFQWKDTFHGDGYDITSPVRSDTMEVPMKVCRELRNAIVSRFPHWTKNPQQVFFHPLTMHRLNFWTGNTYAGLRIVERKKLTATTLGHRRTRWDLANSDVAS